MSERTHGGGSDLSGEYRSRVSHVDGKQAGAAAARREERS
jgi:hypothetical protein